LIGERLVFAKNAFGICFLCLGVVAGAELFLLKVFGLLG